MRKNSTETKRNEKANKSIEEIGERNLTTHTSICIYIYKEQKEKKIESSRIKNITVVRVKSDLMRSRSLVIVILKRLKRNEK